MEFLVLGPLEARDGDAVAELGGGKPRALLALLLLDVGRVVSPDRLIEELWGVAAPASARKMVQIHVSHLRKALGPDWVRTHAVGYSIEVEPDMLDIARFEHLAAEGRAALAAGDPARASQRLGRALGLWRGTALAEFAEPFAEREGARLEALRLAALEDRFDADLALGRHAEVATELDVLVQRHPHRERLRGQHMLALYRSARQADALASYRDAYRTLAEELGIQPSVQLRELEQRILAHDPALAPPGDRADAPPPVAAPQPAGATRYASRGDTSLAYQVYGDGELELAVTTGWVLPMELFRDEPRFAHFLDRLGAFARVLLWDKRGTGLSDRIAPGTRPTLEERTVDLATVIDAAGFERPALLGLSEGAYLSALYAVMYPERASMLALYGGWPRTLRAPDYPWGDTAEQFAVLIDEVREHWADATYLLRYWAPASQHDELLGAWWARALRLGASPTAAVTWLEMMADLDVRAELAQIRAPSLVLHRRGDVIVPVGNGRHFAECIPDAEYTELPGEDHLWWMGDQDALLDAIQAFCLRRRALG
jgi:DNA-binding SARP family transcriptional activator/pimeloyl-ACP methyl ester carboxylesterase